jgi:hypothetical protein
MSKQRILATFQDRNESEIILDSHELEIGISATATGETGPSIPASHHSPSHHCIEVAAFSANVEGVVNAAITATWRRTITRQWNN